MAQTVFHPSIEGAQHGAKSLGQFLYYAKDVGGSLSATRGHFWAETTSPIIGAASTSVVTEDSRAADLRIGNLRFSRDVLVAFVILVIATYLTVIFWKGASVSVRRKGGELRLDSRNQGRRVERR